MAHFLALRRIAWLVAAAGWTSSAAVVALEPTSPPWFEAGRREIRAIADARRTETFATAGDGTSAHPWTGWETAFQSIPSSGGRVQFGEGVYKQTAQIKLPTGLTGWLAIVGGPGVTIHLT